MMEPHKIVLFIDEKVLQHLEAEVEAHMLSGERTVSGFLVYTIIRNIRNGENERGIAQHCDFNEQFAARFGEPPQGEYPWSILTQ